MSDHKGAAPIYLMLPEAEALAVTTELIDQRQSRIYRRGPTCPYGMTGWYELQSASLLSKHPASTGWNIWSIYSSRRTFISQFYAAWS
jgi:hypothetical protein